MWDLKEMESIVMPRFCTEGEGVTLCEEGEEEKRFWSGNDVFCFIAVEFQEVIVKILMSVMRFVMVERITGVMDVVEMYSYGLLA